MYYIMMLSLSMEVIPAGKAGFFDGLVGLGAAIGAFLGPFLAFHLNYIPMFIITAVIFLVASNSELSVKLKCIPFCGWILL